MESLLNLLPELAEWNDGDGIAPSDWILGVGRGSHALALCSLLWPEVAAFEGYVLRKPVNVDHLKGWEAGGRASRQQIENAMNMLFLEDIFPDDQCESALKAAQTLRLAQIMVDMLSAKLAREFQSRRFKVFIIDDGDDFGVTFHQA